MHKKKGRILTGDRPTGKLHLGHLVGSLQKRVDLQYEYDSYIIIADVQALTTHWENDSHLEQDIINITADYLAAGLDPNESTIFIQSYIPEIHELTMYFSLFTPVNVLRHNPTIKSEAAQHGFKDITYGFLGYPISQAADIAIFKANTVPVGEDQLPHIELARRIVRRFNDLYAPVLIEPKALTSSVPRLVGLDGKNKMSKSLNNCIFLADDSETVIEKVKNAVTDPARIRKSDLGHPEICTVCDYHRIFNRTNLEEIELACRQGKIGCVECKNKLSTAINSMLEPMHARRKEYSDPNIIRDILVTGTEKARAVAKNTMQEIREAMCLNYFSKNS